MLNRLSAIAKQIEEHASRAKTPLESLNNIESAEVTAQTLEKAINRFKNELHNYFRLSTEPAVVDISSFSEVQIKGEEILTELNVKLTRKRELQGGATNINREQLTLAIKQTSKTQFIQI